MILPLWMALAAGTLVSEDLACAAAGLLVQQQALTPLQGVSACAIGIFAGDLGLWATGRLSGSVLGRLPFVQRRVRSVSSAALSRLQRGARLTILGSRFLPGSRLPLYVGAGLARVPFGVFASWTALAVALWTPLVVLGSAGLAGGAETAAHVLGPWQDAVGSWRK